MRPRLISSTLTTDGSWRVFVCLVRAWVCCLLAGAALLGSAQLLAPALLTICAVTVGALVGLAFIGAVAAGVVYRGLSSDFDWRVSSEAARGIAEIEALLARQVSEGG